MKWLPREDAKWQWRQFYAYAPHRCRECQQKFWLENGWRKLTTLTSAMRLWLFVCRECMTARTVVETSIQPARAQ